MNTSTPYHAQSTLSVTWDSPIPNWIKVTSEIRLNCLRRHIAYWALENPRSASSALNVAKLLPSLQSLQKLPIIRYLLLTEYYFRNRTCNFPLSWNNLSSISCLCGLPVGKVREASVFYIVQGGGTFLGCSEECSAARETGFTNTNV